MLERFSPICVSAHDLLSFTALLLWSGRGETDLRTSQEQAGAL